MSQKTKTYHSLPWFKFWAGNFRSKTDHLSNAEVGAYIRLLASYWDNNGLPFNARALTRIAMIEAGDNADLGAILGEFFFVKDEAIRHEELDALRIEAIGEEDANKRRTLPARLALADHRNSVTLPVTETEVEVDIEGDSEAEPEGDPQPESEEDSNPQVRPTSQTYTQTLDPDPEPDSHADVELLPIAGDPGCRIPVQIAPTRVLQSASLKPDGGAKGGAVPAVSSAQSGISFRLKDGSTVPLSAVADVTQLSIEALATLKRLAERFQYLAKTRVTVDELPSVMQQWLQPSRRAA